MKTRSEHFDVVIVGSGFGGSVMAWRLAEAGLRVCVLERGKAYPPGSFPRSPHDMRRNFWDPRQGLHGLFNLWSFKGLGGVVSSGLGGGSLIYANVLLRKDEKTFIHEDPRDGGYENWPVTREDLEAHYDAVERMMRVQRYPLEHAPYASTAKTQAMRLAAQRLGRAADWQLPPLAVTFGNPGEAPVPGEPIREEHPNLHGRTRTTCHLCGECDIGCNTGSKNTLDYTYLSAAKRAGAELRTRAEVTELWPADGGGYVVQYLDHRDVTEETPREGPQSMQPRTTVTADRLVLAAGTFGTTYLLLKNRRHFPALSDQLGARFCGNGDLLGFMRQCRDTSTGKALPRILDGGHGPVITSALHFRGAEEGGTGRGYYIEDAGFPEFVNWLYEGAHQVPLLKRGLRLGWRLVRGWTGLTRDSDVSEEIAELLGDCLGSATSLPLLGMGRDIPTGHMRLTEDGMLDIDWKLSGSKAYFDRVRQSMADIATALEGKLVQNPLSYLSRVITVHPLGGCPMGSAPESGVVDSTGEAFGHPGLYVADGAMMPGPTGPNPSLTIAALADRFADHLIDAHHHDAPVHGWRRTEEEAWPSAPRM
ncbi:GMC family oxidoreductase [Corallococcus praedator]|uniref:Cholesterol oxidase n=1 Tax=Corallococcus praedator TaxID=2316724 RepID=A0ABX9QRN4_9BACT|nr:MULTISPECIES: GMC family oxidoreductase [Corallococcus]RKH34444.1 GMC family oxidoreductase [Corallococcus sp. CA031C]RKI15503.1 GMC family oxidoreductase [Corallococcus praedator]